MVVGVPGDTISGNNYQGSAYLFNRNRGGANNWGQFRRLLASDGAKQDNFGASVSISGNFVVVGAPRGDGTYIQQGSAYIFARDQGGVNNWGVVKKLLASDGARDDRFGFSVAISGNSVVVGAKYNEIDSNYNQGSAYLYKRNSGGTNNWGQTRRFLASDGDKGDTLGSSVAISGSTIVVGANGKDDGSNPPGPARGAAYIY